MGDVYERGDSMRPRPEGTARCSQGVAPGISMLGVQRRGASQRNVCAKVKVPMLGY